MRVQARPDLQFQAEWAALLKNLRDILGDAPELEAVLMLIGLQEIGLGPLKMNKQQKMECLHVAICSLLVPYGYYSFIGRDEDGWPHFELLKPVPELAPTQQHRFIKTAILGYFQAE
jgi:hypothetical protein